MTSIQHRRCAAAAAAVAVVALAATGCGGSSSTSGGPGSPAPTRDRPASATGFPTTANSSAASSPTITQADLDAAMLDRNDIGYGFVAGTYQPNAAAGPCEPTGTPSVDQRVPPEFSAGRTFDSGSGSAEITQNAAIYATPAQAARAFALAVRGESCRHGTLSDGTRVTISAGHDVTGQVNDNGVGKSTVWQLSSGSIRAVIVATLAGRVADVCIFVAAADVNTSRLPNPVAIAKTAFDKLLAH